MVAYKENSPCRSPRARHPGLLAATRRDFGKRPTWQVQRRAFGSTSGPDGVPSVTLS